MVVNSLVNICSGWCQWGSSIIVAVIISHLVPSLCHWDMPPKPISVEFGLGRFSPGLLKNQGLLSH